MQQEDIGIIGFGTVGQNVKRLLFPQARVVDPKKFASQYPKPSFVDGPGAHRYRVAFVCVPTEMREDGSANTSIVMEAIRDNHADVFVIKSTVPPGSTDRLAHETGKRTIFSPEFWGGTQHANAVDHDFVILGRPMCVPWEAASIVAEKYKEIAPASFRILKTTAVTAELVKYAENAFLATKVTFFAEFYRLCTACGVDVDEWRELLLNDERIGRSHSFTYRNHPYYDSHCLNKDIPAILREADNRLVSMPLLSAVVAANDEAKRDHA